MKQPTDRTRVLIQQLHSLSLEDRDILGRPLRDNIAQAIDLIYQIAASKEWASVFALVPFLVVPEMPVAMAAAKGLETMLQNIRPALLLQLDDRLRGGFWSASKSLDSWNQMKYAKLERVFYRKEPVYPFGVASFHRDGYTREAAIKRLARTHTGEELPFLLIRLTDWVPEVRLMAEHFVKERIKPNYLPHFLRSLPLMERLKKKRRRQESDAQIAAIEHVFRVLRQSEHRTMLFDGLLHEDHEVRRASLNLLMDSGAGDTEEIIERVARDRDLANRLKLFELAAKTLPSKQISAVTKLLRDKAPVIRQNALDVLCELKAVEHELFLKAAVQDRSAIVRNYARWKLTELKVDMDFRQLYLQLLTEAKRSESYAIAIRGLGEVGRREDAEIVADYIDHQAVQVVKAATLAVANLDAVGYMETFLQLLSDKVPGISRTAKQVLKRRPELLSADALWQLLDNNSPWHAKRNILKLLNQTDKWDRISLMLIALSNEDVDVQQIAQESIESWHIRYRTTWQFTKPNAAQYEKLIEGMTKASNKLPEEMFQILQECVKA